MARESYAHRSAGQAVEGLARQVHRAGRAAVPMRTFAPVAVEEMRRDQAPCWAGRIGRQQRRPGAVRRWRGLGLHRCAGHGRDGQVLLGSTALLQNGCAGQQGFHGVQEGVRQVRGPAAMPRSCCRVLSTFAGLCRMCRAAAARRAYLHRPDGLGCPVQRPQGQQLLAAGVRPCEALQRLHAASVRAAGTGAGWAPGLGARAGCCQQARCSGRTVCTRRSSWHKASAPMGAVRRLLLQLPPAVHRAATLP